MESPGASLRFIKNGLDKRKGISATACQHATPFFLRDTRRAPEHLKQLLEISLTGLIHWGIAVAEAGADIIVISDPTVSRDVMSKDTWVEFGFPFLKRLVDALKKTGKPLKLHVCGDTTDRVDTFVQAGFDILSPDTKVDFGVAREEVGDGLRS